MAPFSKRMMRNWDEDFALKAKIMRILTAHGFLSSGSSTGGVFGFNDGRGSEDLSVKGH